MLVGCCVACGCSAFGAAYVLCDDGWPHQQATGRADPLGGMMRAVIALPPIARAVESASVVRGRADCLRQMPVMLDVVTLGLQAGLSFDSSLELYCQRYDNELAKVLSAALMSWRLGTASRDEALTGAARRLGVTSLERFAAVVSQALAFGSPLASTLERQAQAIRDEQRSQMEEEIERVPVKMLIPLGTLIVPAMLLAILGPLLGASLQFG